MNMALKRLSLTSPSPSLLLFTIILILLCTSVAAIRLPLFDELNPSTGNKPPLIERRESTENLPADHESTDHESVNVSKKKPQVIRLDIKHEEHGIRYNYLPIPSQQPTTIQHSRRSQQNIPEDYYTPNLGTKGQYEDQDKHLISHIPEPYDKNTFSPGDGSSGLYSREPHFHYDHESPSQVTNAQNNIHVARRGLELVKGNCFLPSPAGNKCHINKCHCVTYDAGVGSEIGSSTGECWCPMTEVGGQPSKREIALETAQESYQKYGNPQIHKRGLRGRAQAGGDHLFAQQQPHNMKQDAGFPKVYKRGPEPLPARKGNGKKTGKCKGGKCNKGTRKQQIEGKRRSKAV